VPAIWVLSGSSLTLPRFPGKDSPDPNTCRKEPTYTALIEKRRDTYRKNKDILWPTEGRQERRTNYFSISSPPSLSTTTTFTFYYHHLHYLLPPPSLSTTTTFTIYYHHLHYLLPPPKDLYMLSKDIIARAIRMLINASKFSASEGRERMLERCLCDVYSTTIIYKK
jgi:hypothetical protein